VLVHTETGALPLAAGAVWVAMNVVIPVGLTFALSPDDEELDPENIPPELADCVDLDPLTPGARSQAIKNLATWRGVAQSRYTGAAQAVAVKTVDNVKALIEKDADAEGNAVGQCHVRAGLFIVERQFAKLDRSSGGAPSVPLPIDVTQSDATTPAPSINPVTIAAIGAGALALAAVAWRLTK
jgi:hypothetical protein